MQLRNTLILVVALLSVCCLSQSNIGCLNPEGKLVDWFTIITTPGSVHKNDPDSGYLYFDSTMKTRTFKISSGHGNEDDAPIGRTIAQIAKFNLQNAVWNDQLYPEWGYGSGSAKKAHAKGYIAVTSDKSKGFIMDHSTPKYPYVDDGIIQSKIWPPQQDKAQHHFCLTIKSADVAQKLYESSCFINPNIYFNDAFEECGKIQSQDKFRYFEMKTPSALIKAIYKNGYDMITNDKGKKVPFETDIFLDGIVPMIESSIIAQTFGAPAPYEPTCDTQYTVGNSQEMDVNGNKWGQGSDHCKWAYALDNDYTCFGDLNRNTYAQTTRGGAFYCINNPYLNNAIKAININHQGC